MEQSIGGLDRLVPPAINHQAESPECKDPDDGHDRYRAGPPWPIESIVALQSQYPKAVQRCPLILPHQEPRKFCRVSWIA